MSDRGERRTVDFVDERQRVHIGLSPWQDENDAREELDRSLALGRDLLDSGTQAWNSYYRWWGPFKFFVAKEVGPPPWRIPRVGAWLKLRPPSLSLVAGWRSTAFRLHIVWQRKPSDSGGNK